MSTCRECIELLRAYVDNELRDDVKQRFEEHMGDCGACVDFLNTYKKTGTLCERALQKEMPKDFQNKLSAFLKSEIEKLE